MKQKKLKSLIEDFLNEYDEEFSDEIERAPKLDHEFNLEFYSDSLQCDIKADVEVQANYSAGDADVGIHSGFEYDVKIVNLMIDMWDGETGDGPEWVTAEAYPHEIPQSVYDEIQEKAELKASALLESPKKSAKTVLRESGFGDPGSSYEVEFYSDSLQTEIKAEVVVVFEAGEKGDYMNPSFDDSYNAEIQSVQYHDFDGEGSDGGWLELNDWQTHLDHQEIEAIQERAIELAKDEASVESDFDHRFDESAEYVLESFNVTLLPESHPDGLDVQVEAVIDPRKRGSKVDPSYAPAVKFKSIRILETNKLLAFKNLSEEDREALTEHALDLFKAELQSQYFNEMEQPLDFGRFDKSLRDGTDF